MALPVVAIVGRPNVGKSTLFNRIINERLAIVEDRPGVTRDRNYAQAEWLGRKFDVIDTGGITWDDGKIEEEIRAQAEIAIDEADVIVMLTSVVNGVTDLDEKVAQLLYRTKKPVILAVNKADNPEQRANIYDFYRMVISAQNTTHHHNYFIMWRHQWCFCFSKRRGKNRRGRHSAPNRPASKLDERRVVVA